MESREFYMKEALSMARDAFSHEEVPVGCVIVSPEGRILARERNHCRERQDATAHAELLAIQQAEKALGSPPSGRMHPLCDAGTLSDVCGSHRPYPYLSYCVRSVGTCHGMLRKRHQSL